MSTPAIARAEAIVGALSGLLGQLDRMVIGPTAPGSYASVRAQRPGQDFLPHIVLIASAIDEARTFLIEGGNPIGPEANVLAECLLHLERARQANSYSLAERWAAIAYELRGLVQDNLSAMLARKQKIPVSETGRIR